MRIVCLEARARHHIPYLNAGKKGIEKGALPVHFGRVQGLPHELSALVVTSDLQFVTPPGPRVAPRLMGEALPGILARLVEGEESVRLDRSGAILAGDMFALTGLEDRGGIGDVSPVWKAFGNHFRWVAGVLGNHDELDPSRLAREDGTPDRAHLLDGSTCLLDTLRIGGVSGILQRGERPRPTEKGEAEFLRRLEDVLGEEPDLVVLHHGPAAGSDPGSPEIARALDDGIRALELVERGRAPLIICGHRHWERLLATLECGVQVLNVDKRVVVLQRE